MASVKEVYRAMSLIVILDDQATNRTIFAQLAASLKPGLDVQTFGAPDEALAFLADRNPALVITDYKMPVMDGAEFTRRLRAIPNGADVPVIVITAYEDRSFRLRALEAGATDFLLYPVDHQEFLVRARNLLTLGRQQQIIKRRTELLERELEESERTRQVEIRSSRERLAQVIDTMPAMISAVDTEGRLEFINAYQAAFLGLDARECIGQDATCMFGSQHRERMVSLDRMVIESGRALPSYEEEIVDRKGNTHVFLTTKSPLFDKDHRVVGVLTTALDITERKQAESRLRYLAHHDPLTDLPNRVLLGKRMERKLARRRYGDHQFALHFLDLDRFKGVNDVLGHHSGDQLLQAVAKRLRETVRETDLVARLGGDEFAILQSPISTAEEAAALAQKVLDALSEPFVFHGHQIELSACIGITLYPSDGQDVEELLRNADLAMYRAKDEGSGTYQFFVDDMNRRAFETARLESDLRSSFANKHFRLHYQPLLCLRSGKIAGAEALLRWNRPGIGEVAPSQFLPLAEEIGLIASLSSWVLQEVCATAARWQSAGLRAVRCAVNLSPLTFRRQDVYAMVVSALEQSGLDPAWLELELTENILLENNDDVKATLHALQALGVGLALDDFGTGYSSLSYVKNFPVDRIKIDQSFIRDLKTDPSNTTIVRAIINLSHGLNLEVVAEGVETMEQCTQLAADGCDLIQGYYVSPPLPAEEFGRLLELDTTAPLAGIVRA